MRVQSVDRPFTHAGIDDVIATYTTKQPKLYTEYVDVVENRDSSYYRVAQEGDFGLPGEINQATGITYQDFSTGNYKDFYAYKRGLGFALPTERLDTDFYGLMTKRAKKMARAMTRAIEADMANFFNLATSSTFLGPDGKALVATDHPLDNGTASNTISGNPVLSYSALATARSEFMNEPTQAGDYGMKTGPFLLLIGTNGVLWDKAMRLLGTKDRLIGSADNDKPWANLAIKDVIAVPWITSTTAWMLIDLSGDNPLKMIRRRDFKSSEQYDQDRDIIKYAVNQIWGRAITDWRGVRYSAGA